MYYNLANSTTPSVQVNYAINPINGQILGIASVTYTNTSAAIPSGFSPLGLPQASGNWIGGFSGLPITSVSLPFANLAGISGSVPGSFANLAGISGAVPGSFAIAPNGQFLAR